MFVSLVIIGSLTGCVASKHSTCHEFTRNAPMLLVNEVAQLREIELNNEFISGCITEEIADMSECFCVTSNDLS